MIRLKKRLLKKLQEKTQSDDYQVFYQDEVHFKLTLSLIRAWFLKGGKSPEIKSPTDRFKMSIFGAMSKNGQLITLQNEVFNALTFKLFLEKLVLDAERGYTKQGKRKKILLVLDNARYHHAKLLQPWLEEMENILELFFLPPYSPDLNAIERLWKKTRRNVTHNRFFESLDNLCYDLKMYWSQFTNPNQELELLSVNI